MIRPLIASDRRASDRTKVINVTRSVSSSSVPYAAPVAFAPALISEPLNGLITPEYAPRRAVAEKTIIKAPVIATETEPVPINSISNKTTARIFRQAVDRPARTETTVNNTPQEPQSAPEPTITVIPEERRTVETSELTGRTIADKDIVHIDTGEPRTAQPNELGFGRTPDNNTPSQDPSRNNTDTEKITSVPVLTEPSINAGVSPWKIGGMAIAGAAGVGGGVLIEKLISNVKDKKIEKAKPVKKNNTVVFAGVGLLALLLLLKLLKIK